MWTFRGFPISCHACLLPGCTDIVYELVYASGRRYIGKKRVRAMRRLKPTKKQLAIRKNYKRIELKELPFVDYKGSHDCPGNEVLVEKNIIYQCSDKKTATYFEAKLLFQNKVLFDPEFMNKNISGKFFLTDATGVLGHDDVIL